MRSSDLHLPVTVLEGMPGAGKTTLAGALADAGHTVLGEYTTPEGTTVPLADHPDRVDDDGHLSNWLRKSGHIRDRATPLWVDRDWITALAWGVTTGVLSERAAWASQNLRAGRLLLPDRWVILDVAPQVSLERRAGILDPEHPWSDPAQLRLLRAFYRDPASTIVHDDPELARIVAEVPAVHLDATEPTSALLAALAPAGARS